MLVNRHNVEIEWGDCDPAGIVFYPRYFAMLDAATSRLFEAALGMKKIAWAKHYRVVGTPMVDTGANFKIALRYGDIIVIESRVKQFGRSSFKVEHRVFKGEDLAIEAWETRVWAAVHPEREGALKGIAIPQEVVAALSRG